MQKPMTAAVTIKNLQINTLQYKQDTAETEQGKVATRKGFQEVGYTLEPKLLGF